MALATQCPHCQTTFRVAHDQLKLRAGLVRCGACKQIFNGIEHLVRPDQLTTPPAAPKQQADAAPVAAPTTETALAPAVNENTPPEASPAPPIAQLKSTTIDFVDVDEPEPTAASVSSNNAVDEVKDQDIDEEHATDDPETDPLQRMTLVDFTAIDETEDDQESKEAPAEETVQRAWLDDEHDDDSDHKVLPHDSVANEDSTDAVTAPTEPAASDIAAAKDSPETDVPATDSMDEHTKPVSSPLHVRTFTEDLDEPEVAEDEEPSFVKRSKKRQRVSRIMRFVMAIGSVVLLAALIVQGGYAFRNQLAAWFPQTKPVLAQLCQAVGCQVRLPSQIDMVSIESNELQALPPSKNIFTLTVLLRNRSSIPQAWPHIELTLNDSSEKPVVRRVLTPREYLPATQDAAKGFAANSEQSAKVLFELSQIKASGYRIYMFYP